MLTIRSLFLALGRRALGTSTRQITADKTSFQTYQTRKNRFKSNPLVRTLWSAMTRVEHLAQINRDIRPKVQAGDVVICDRYLWDSITDLAVLHKKDPRWLWSGLNGLMWKFVPQPALTIFIDIPPEEALRRKDDITSFDEIKERAYLYRCLAERKSFTAFNGCDDVQSIQRKVRRTVEALLNSAA